MKKKNLLFTMLLISILLFSAGCVGNRGDGVEKLSAPTNLQITARF